MTVLLDTLTQCPAAALKRWERIHFQDIKQDDPA
jgi:hypothetical protein